MLLPLRLNMETVNPYAGKPRKGTTILDYTPDLDFYSFNLSTQNFIASIYHWNRGQTTFSVLQDDNSGYHIDLTRVLEEVSIGDRRVRTDLDITSEDASSGGEALFTNRFDGRLAKELIISYRTDFESLTVYLGGRAIEIQTPGFNPTRLDILEDSEDAVKHIRFHSLYVPSEVDTSTIPQIWRKWFKDQIETNEGYPSFSEAFRVYIGGNTYLDQGGGANYWDLRGLHVDEPVPEDYENRDAGLLVNWIPPVSSDPSWDNDPINLTPA